MIVSIAGENQAAPTRGRETLRKAALQGAAV
jgi:hypothetical protein